MMSGFVTGSSSGIGLAIVKKLAAQQINCVLVALDDELMRSSLAELGAKIVDSPRELRSCDIVFTTVSASDDLIAVCTGPDGLQPTSDPAVLPGCPGLDNGFLFLMSISDF